MKQGHEYCHDSCYKLDRYIKQLEQDLLAHKVNYDETPCLYCKKGVHSVYDCYEFKKLSEESRMEWLYTCLYCGNGVHGIYNCDEFNKLSDESQVEWLSNDYFGFKDNNPKLLYCRRFFL